MQAQLHAVGVKVWQRHGKLPKKYGKSVNTANICRLSALLTLPQSFPRYRNRKDIMTCVPCGFCTESKSFSDTHNKFPSGIRFCPSACGWCPKPFGLSRRKIVAENLYADPLRLGGFLLPLSKIAMTKYCTINALQTHTNATIFRDTP